MNVTRKSFIYLLLAALLPPAAARGADGDETAGSKKQDDQMMAVREVLFVEESLPFMPASNTILAKLPLPLARTPANVGVVGPEVLVEQRTRVLGDALENVSGINVQTGNGVFDFFVVRGFDSLSSGLVLTDGAPEPEVTFYQMYNAERVEVLKGPGGFLYGSNPLAGAVNIVRKQPVPSRFGAVSASYGSHGTFDTAVDLNTTNSSGSLSLRLNALWGESDGYRDDRDSRVGAFNPALTWNPDDRSSLHLNLEHVSADFHPDAGLPLDAGGELFAVPRERSLASPFDFSDQAINRVQIDYERELSDSITIRNKTYYRELDWETDGTLLAAAFPSPAGLTVFRSLLLLDDRQTFLGNQLEVVVRRETGGIQHSLLAGLETARFADEFTLDVALLPPIDLFNPVETAAEPLFFIPGTSAAGDARSVVVAPYLVDQITVSQRLQLLVGLRFDAIDFEDDRRGASRSDGELSPMLGAVYSPAQNLSLYANAGRSFAPPSPRAAGLNEPEESTQLELGLRREWREGRVRATVALFQIERENIAIPDDNGFTQQVGDQRSRGLELEAAAELPGGVRGLFSYAYTDSELTRFTEFFLLPTDPPFGVLVDRSGNRSAFAPEHLANIWLSRGFRGGWRLAGGARFVDDQFIAPDNERQIDGYALLDASVSYTFGDWRLSLRLENLTDEEYLTRGFGSLAAIPGQPFSAFLGFEKRL